jgi:Uncharacterized lipoprotein
MRGSRTGMILAMVTAVAMPALAAKKLLVGIPLLWKPTEAKNAGVVNLTGVSEVKVQVAKFTDTRPDPTKIGENTEDSPARPVTTNDDVAAFISTNVTDTLRSYGFKLVPDGGDVIVRGEVLEFMVRESNTYKGEVRLKATVERAGKPVWTGVVSGSSSRFGRSYKADNYYETLSDAILGAASNLASDPGFHQALAAH